MVAAKRGYSRAFAIIAVCVIGLCACQPWRGLPRIALLAPFEGRYREVGYNAFYAARLALEESGAATSVEFIAVDDGGSVDSALARAQALATDPSIAGVIILGPAASADTVLNAFGTIPQLIVGHWTPTEVMPSNALSLSSPDTADMIQPDLYQALIEGTALPTDQPLVAGDEIGLEHARLLLPEGVTATMLTSGEPASADFAARYRASAMFAPAPNHLAELTYRATAALVSASQHYPDHTRVQVALDEAFPSENGYWINAPLNAFQIDSASMRSMALDDVVEQR